MSRRKIKAKKILKPDPIYNSTLITQIINKIMKNGKKTTSENIMYSILKNIKETKNQNPMEVIKKSIENITPKVEIKARRIGGATYQIPIEINETRGKNIAIKILIKSARKRTEKNMVSKLQNEIIDSYNNIGNSIKKKEEMHKMAEANKAFTILRI
jgi:small subunit ribosomal protein S7